MNDGIRLPFDGRLSSEESRMLAEGAIDDFEWPVWFPDPQVFRKEAA